MITNKTVELIMRKPDLKNYIREADASQHNGGIIERPPEAPRYHTSVMLEGFQRESETPSGGV